MPEQLSGLLIHAIGTPPWLLTPVKVSTSSELYPDYFWLPTFFACSSIQFFDSPPFSQQSHLGYLCLLAPHFAGTCVTYITLCHASDHQVLPTQPLPREAQDVHGVAIILSMCLCSHT